MGLDVTFFLENKVKDKWEPNKYHLEPIRLTRNYKLFCALAPMHPSVINKVKNIYDSEIRCINPHYGVPEDAHNLTKEYLKFYMEEVEGEDKIGPFWLTLSQIDAYPWTDIFEPAEIKEFYSDIVWVLKCHSKVKEDDARAIYIFDW